MWSCTEPASLIQVSTNSFLCRCNSLISPHLPIHMGATEMDLSFTARVRSTREGTVYTLFVSSSGAGRGYPAQGTLTSPHPPHHPSSGKGHSTPCHPWPGHVHPPHPTPPPGWDRVPPSHPLARTRYPLPTLPCPCPVPPSARTRTGYPHTLLCPILQPEPGQGTPTLPHHP